MGFLSAMLALMALRQTLTLISSANSTELSITAHATELPGLAVSVLAFLSIFFLEHIITERRKIHRELRSSEERLRESQKLEAVGRLAGGVAHDFNNLLTAILGYSEILTSKFDSDSEAREAAIEIQRAGKRAAELTRQLLAFSRKQALRPEVLDLNTIVTNLESMLRRLIGEQIDFRVRLNSKIGAVNADTTQLEQVIVNLVVNARDAMDGGGVLEVTTSETELDDADLSVLGEGARGPYICLSVSDTGEGMDTATQAQIFEPFFTRKSNSGGTGLGLATVFGIVRQSGGTIRVKSEIRVGTRFEILLPRVEHSDPTPVVAARTADRVDTPVPSWTILLVEDDPAILRLVRRAVESAGHRVLSATNGEEALKIARDHPNEINLLLTDVIMRGMTGIALADALCDERPDLVVIFMSGYSEQSVTDPHRLPTRAQFLSKPFSSKRLIEAIHRAQTKRPSRPGEK
jgi:two-component system cell cycle sensor histidine kinase/response regulator CckA